MDELIIRVLSGSASSFEVERLERWREESPENERTYQEALQVWGLTTPEAVVPASGPPPVEEVLERAARERGVVLPLRRSRPRAWAALGLLAASVAALALGIGVVGNRGPEVLATHDAAGTASTTVALADGSFVRLAPGSRLREWAGEETRDVSLEGKAFFAVARDETRPFVVHAGGGTVEVLGTRFQVDTGEDFSETVVVEGLVRVTNGRGSVEVPAGSSARQERGREPTVQTEEDVYALLDWPNGTLVFQGTPLAQVAREVSRHYGLTLQPVGPELANRRITAWFQGEAFEDVAESLCLVTEAVCTPSDTGIVMQLQEGAGIL